MACFRLCSGAWVRGWVGAWVGAWVRGCVRVIVCICVCEREEGERMRRVLINLGKKFTTERKNSRMKENSGIRTYWPGALQGVRDRGGGRRREGGKC